MSEKNKYKEIYDSNIIYPSINHKCGVVIEDNKAYKCPPNKFCNVSGFCENIECYQYGYGSPYEIKIDISKFDGNDVSRNSLGCNYPISTDGKCGLDNNNTKCPDKQCCSIKDTCGYDKESCISITTSNSPKAITNRNVYSNYKDVYDFEDEFIKKIHYKYIDSNKFEKSTDGSCGIDLMNEKIKKCPDNKCCISYKCESGEKCNNADPNSKLHGDKTNNTNNTNSYFLSTEIIAGVVIGCVLFIFLIIFLYLNNIIKY